MKILVIWGESLCKPGGGTVHCLGLVDGLRNCGHDVCVISPRYAGQDGNPIGSAFRALRLPRRNLFSFAVFQLLTVLLLPVWMIRYRPDVIYVRTCFLQGAMSIMARFLGIFLVGEVDNVVDIEIDARGEPGWWKPIIRLLDRINYRWAAGSVCVTEKLRLEVIRRGGVPERTVHVPNGASVDLFRPMDRAEARRQFPELPKDAFLVGFAGTFAPWIGLDLLFETARILSKQSSGITFAIMGDGQMAPQVRRWAAEPELANSIILLPQSERSKVRVFLNACNIAVMPFNHAGILRYGLSSLKFWDAVSLGLPVLVPAGCELDEVLADLNLPGTFEAGKAESLADSIVRLATNVDAYRGRRNEIHERVRVQYSWDTVAARVAAFLESLRAGKKTVRECA